MGTRTIEYPTLPYRLTVSPDKRTAASEGQGLSCGHFTCLDLDIMVSHSSTDVVIGFSQAVDPSYYCLSQVTHIFYHWWSADVNCHSMALLCRKIGLGSKKGPCVVVSVSKAQQLLQGLQAPEDEGQQLTAVMEMCQVGGFHGNPRYNPMVQLFLGLYLYCKRIVV